MESENSNQERVVVHVWGWEIRVLHWVNAFLILTLALLMLGKEGMEYLGVEKALREPINTIHVYFGYVFAVTFTLRIIAGFVGSHYARWHDIIPYRKEKWQAIAQNLRWYLTGFSGAPARVVGHDPLASLFYIALFIVLVLQILAGLTLAGTELHMLPGSLIFGGMGEHALETIGEVAEEVHEFGFWFIIFFIFAHLGGLIVHEIKEHTGLFSSMIHGKKYLPKE